MKGNHDYYSTGPFSRVFFVYDVTEGLDTYTYRHWPQEPAGTLVRTLISMPPGMPFHEIFVRTSLIRNPEIRRLPS